MKATASNRATVYLDPDLHKALRIKAVETDHSVSDLINEAIRHSLREDAEDLAAFRQRAHEPTLDFEQLVQGLKKRGKL
jgi:predicted transcriptional regulator